MRTGLIAVAAALLLAPAAVAFTDEQIGRAVAFRVWGKARCGWVTAERVEGGLFAPGRMFYGASAYVGDKRCTIKLNADWLDFQAQRPTYLRRLAYCTVFVHEWGHLQGRHHTTGGIMSEPAPENYWPCVRVVRWVAAMERR